MIALPALCVLLAIGLILARTPRPTWHRGERPFACRACDLTFSDARQVVWHWSAHHPATFDAKETT